MGKKEELLRKALTLYNVDAKEQDEFIEDLRKIEEEAGKPEIDAKPQILDRINKDVDAFNKGEF